MVGDPLASSSAYWTTWGFDTLGNRASQVDHATTSGGTPGGRPGFEARCSCTGHVAVAGQRRCGIRGQVTTPGQPRPVDIRRRQAQQDIRWRARVVSQSAQQRIHARLRDGGKLKGRRHSPMVAGYWRCRDI
jgi:hypothetical protein